MNKYINITFILTGVWAIASVLNGFSCGIAICLLDHLSPGVLLLSIVFSFVFSAPLVGIVWFVTLMAQVADKKGNSLFRFVLGTAFICAIVAALVFIYIFRTEFVAARYAVGLCIIISALTAVLFFRKKIKANE